MTEKGFQTIQNAIGSIQFFRAHYGSGGDFPSHFAKVLAMLREAGKNASHDRNLLLGFADALEQANRGGEYRSGINQ